MAVDDDQVDDEDNVGDESADDGPARTSRGGGAGRATISGGDGAGWVLGLVLWAGVVLPFIQHGPAGVKAWWLAKFLNKAPDGSELP